MLIHEHTSPRCWAAGGGQAWRVLGMRLSKPGCGSESPDELEQKHRFPAYSQPRWRRLCGGGPAICILSGSPRRIWEAARFGKSCLVEYSGEGEEEILAPLIWTPKNGELRECVHMEGPLAHWPGATEEDLEGGDLHHLHSCFVLLAQPN